jgi:hypothetical protein
MSDPGEQTTATSAASPANTQLNTTVTHITLPESNRKDSTELRVVLLTMDGSIKRLMNSAELASNPEITAARAADDGAFEGDFIPNNTPMNVGIASVRMALKEALTRGPIRTNRS